MRFSRVELVFIVFGAALGALVAWAAGAGLLARIAGLPPLLFILLGLALAEVVAGFATGRAPGQLVGMPARFIAFVVGVGALLLLGGRIA